MTKFFKVFKIENRAGNPFSSDEDVDSTEEEKHSESDQEIDEQKKEQNISKFKKGKVFKSLTNNWRLNRHEREQFLNSQNVSR